MIEEVLFGEFVNQRKGFHKKLAAIIFQSSLETSRMKWLETKNTCEDPRFIYNVCRTRLINFDDDDDTKLIGDFPPGNPPYWSPHTVFCGEQYSFWTTVYLRVNCAFALMEHYECPNHLKIKAFLKAHTSVIRYLDSVPDPRDDIIALPLPYTGMGKTNYDMDRNAIELEHFTHNVRPYPLEILQIRYPNHTWRYEDVTGEEVNTFEACRFIMNQCKVLYLENQDTDSSVREALWSYHGCFLDYCYNRKNDTDPIPLSLYPFDNRCFTAHDLPSCFHILSSIPMWGEQMAPAFPLGKFIQKSLPFAGARRTLISHAESQIKNNEAFWRLFSSVFYCMLLNMYPEEMMGRKQEEDFDLNRLMRAKQLASDKRLLCDMLSLRSFNYSSNKETDKGCYVVFTAFRLWIVWMAHNQKHFHDAVPIDWDAFVEQTIEMSRIIQSSDLFAADAFKIVRDTLSKSGKNPKSKIYRYRTSNVIDTLLDRMMESLEKDLYKELESWRCNHPDQIPELFEQYVDTDIPLNIKENILNTLIRIPKEEWLEPLTLSLLRHPQYGGVYDFTIVLVQDLIHVYYKSAKPKDFTQIVQEFHIPDFKVVCWYFHVIGLLNKIDFEPLTFETVTRIDYALMNTKHVLYPGQPLPDDAFNVFFTLCCGKIKTLTGKNGFGHPNVAYDMENDIYVCAKNQKKLTQYDTDDFAFSEFESQRKNARKHRKEFNEIPCVDNPVLSIPLRGFMLIYNKTERYMHCPKCGAFHRYHSTGFQGGEYACPECKQDTFYTTCSTCGVEGAKEKWPVENPEATKKGDVFQYKYFCRKHLKAEQRNS